MSAIQYVTSAGGGAVFEELQSSSSTTFIRGTQSDSHFDKGVIYWNPYGALGVVSNGCHNMLSNGAYRVRSPAVILAHEAKHASDFASGRQFDEDLFSLEIPKYDSDDSEHYATKFENQIAENLGEPIRTKYNDWFSVPSVLSPLDSWYWGSDI
jgi:hypothetical protein